MNVTHEEAVRLRAATLDDAEVQLREARARLLNRSKVIERLMRGKMPKDDRKAYMQVYKVDTALRAWRDERAYFVDPVSDFARDVELVGRARPEGEGRDEITAKAYREALREEELLNLPWNAAILAKRIEEWREA